MREISIIKDFENVGGRKFPNWEKRRGFVNEKRMSAQELVILAGYDDTTEVCVTDSVSDDNFMDDSFEEDRKEAQLIGNHDFGFKDADFNTLGPQYLVPNAGESWVFVLGCPLHIQ